MATDSLKPLNQILPAVYPFPVAALLRAEGPYPVGQAVTTDPWAPWAKGQTPAFLDDPERMAAWKAAGKPVFVDEGRFAAWERDGYFAKAENTTKKEAPDGEAAQ